MQLRFFRYLLLLTLLLAPASSINAQIASKRTHAGAVDTTCADSARLVELREGLKHTGSSTAEEALRKYAWQLLGEVTGPPGGLPTWRRWQVIAPAGQAVATQSSPAEAATLTLFPSEELRILAPTQDLSRQLVTVSVNGATLSHIKLHQLNNRDKLEKYRALGIHQIPEFDCDSMNVKAAWRVVPKGYSLPIGVWTGAKGSPGGLESTWSRWVQVDNGPPQPLATGEGPWNPLNKMNQDAQVSDFYSVLSGTQDPVVIVDTSNEITKQFHQGDTLILVGLHIAVKRHADWFWATFWWNPDGIGDAYKDLMPQWMLDDPRWRHYAMDLDVTMKNYPGSQYQGPVFNPYIEGQGSGGPSTNCMGCHKNAAFPGFSVFAPPNPPDNMENNLLLDYVWSFKSILAPKN